MNPGNRAGDGRDGRYKNTPETAAFLNRESPHYIGALPEMLNARIFGFWNDLGTALKTGQPQNELKTHGQSLSRKPTRRFPMAAR